MQYKKQGGVEMFQSKEIIINYTTVDLIKQARLVLAL